MKKRVLTDISVLLKRNPLVDKTNIIEMPRIITEIKRPRKQNVKVNKSVPYSKASHLNNKENAKPKDTLDRSRDISIEDNTVTKRVRKKPIRCACCTGKNVISKHESIATTVSNRKSNEEVESANKKVDKKMCHDLFNLQCKIIIERSNIQEFKKESRPIQPIKDQQEKDVCEPNLKDKLTTKSKIVNKKLQVCLLNDKNLGTQPSKSLRQQIKPNYAELTLNSSQEDSPKKIPDVKQMAATKVPVYNQKFSGEKSKEPDKLYEFDESDSDPGGQRKGKRLAKKHKPDTSLYTISRKQNAKKGQTKVRQKNKNPKLKGPVRKYNDIMQEVIQRVKIKISQETENAVVSVSDAKKNVKKDQPKQKTKSNMSTLKTIPKTNVLQKNNRICNTGLSQPSTSVQKTDLVKQSVKEISTVDIIKGQLNISPVIIEESFAIDNRDKSTVEIDFSSNIIEDSFATINRPQSRIDIEHGSKNQRLIVDETPTVSDFDKVAQSVFGSRTEQQDINSNDDIIETTKDNLSPADIHDSDDIIDASFNDDDSDNENVSEQDDPDGSFLDFGADVHSTPIRSGAKINIISNVLLHENDSKRKTRSKRKHNPWRFNEAVKRNPHFIILKSSALPCLKQDMVLDHNQVEKIEEHFSKTPRRIETPKKSPVQKSILEYVNSPDRHNQENIPRSSLFDYEEFSPIKTKSPQRTQNRAKRNILGPIQDNAANILPFTSTPAKPSNVRQPFVGENEDDDIANCFGFEDENTIPSVRDKPSEAKPFRIKEYVAKKQTKQVEEKVVEEALPQPEQEPDESEIVNDGVEVGLFDDPEKEFCLAVPSKIYVKKPRRKRLKSVEAEKEDEHHPKKRKKDMMTKAEEAALEEWAAKFNSMCNEIDKYDLEIE